MDGYEEKMKASLATIDAQLKGYQALMTGVKERAAFNGFLRTWNAYLTINKNLISLTRGGKQQDAIGIGEGAAKMTVDEAIVALDNLTALSFVGGKAAAAAAERTYQESCTGSILLLCVALVTGALPAWFITRDLMQVLGGEPSYAAALAGSIAKGDLAVSISVKAGDTSSLM